jgi:hypothetical protein
MPVTFMIFGYLVQWAPALASFLTSGQCEPELRNRFGLVGWIHKLSRGHDHDAANRHIIARALQEPLESKQLIERTHWVSWTGGIFGAIYIAISILLLPRLGTATVIALIVAG